MELSKVNQWIIKLFHLSDSGFSSLFIFALWILLAFVIATIVMKLLKKTLAFAIMMYAIYGSGALAAVSFVIDKIISIFSK